MKPWIWRSTVRCSCETGRMEPLARTMLSASCAQHTGHLFCGSNRPDGSLQRAFAITADR